MNNEELTEVVIEIAETLEAMAITLEKMANVVVNLHKRVEISEKMKNNENS
jgi:hypothetical protein